MAGIVQQASPATPNNRFDQQEVSTGQTAPLQQSTYTPQGPAAVQIITPQKVDDLSKRKMESDPSKTSPEKQTEEKNDPLNTKSFQILSPPNIALGICFLSFAIAGVCWFLNSFSSPKETDCKVP